MLGGGGCGGGGARARTRMACVALALATVPPTAAACPPPLQMAFNINKHIKPGVQVGVRSFLPTDLGSFAACGQPAPPPAAS